MPPLKRRDLLRLPLQPAAARGAPVPSSARVMAYGPFEFTEFPLEEAEAVSRLGERYPVVWISAAHAGEAPVLLPPGIEPEGGALPEDARGDALSLNLALPGAESPELLSVAAAPGEVLSAHAHAGEWLEGVRRELRQGSAPLRRGHAGDLVAALLEAAAQQAAADATALATRTEETLESARRGERLARMRMPRLARLLEARLQELRPLARQLRALADDPPPLLQGEPALPLRRAAERVEAMVAWLEEVHGTGGTAVGGRSRGGFIGWLAGICAAGAAVAGLTGALAPGVAAGAAAAALGALLLVRRRAGGPRSGSAE